MLPGTATTSEGALGILKQHSDAELDVAGEFRLLRRLDVREGETGVMPYAVKTVQDLAKSSVQRKFELERRYWESLGMRLGLLTDRQLRGSRFENIRWLRDWHWTENVNGYDAARWRRTAELAMHIVSSMQGRSVGEVCAAIAAAEGVTAGTAFSVLRHLGARKRLLVDVDLPRPLLRDPIERFALPASAAAAGTAA